jgi:hypothetical protein
MKGLDLLYTMLGFVTGFIGVGVIFYFFSYVTASTYVEFILIGLFAYFFWRRFYKEQNNVYVKNSLIYGVVASVLFFYSYVLNNSLF